MKIKEQTRKLAAGCSKYSFEVVDGTDEVSSKHSFEVVDRTDEVSNHTYGKATLTWFEEILKSTKEQNGCRLLREHGSRWRVLLDDHCHNYV